MGFNVPSFLLTSALWFVAFLVICHFAQTELVLILSLKLLLKSSDALSCHTWLFELHLGWKSRDLYQAEKGVSRGCAICVPSLVISLSSVDMGKLTQSFHLHPSQQILEKYTSYVWRMKVQQSSKMTGCFRMSVLRGWTVTYLWAKSAISSLLLNMWMLNSSCQSETVKSWDGYLN